MPSPGALRADSTSTDASIPLNDGSCSPMSPGSPGTSEATASRALKDDPRIGEATRAAVRAAAHKLGYVPNAAARSLRAQRTHILGLLLDDLADPVHGKVAAGFEEAAASLGYAVFMMTGLHDAEREQRALTAFVEHRADGIVRGVVRQRSSRGATPASQPSAWCSSSPTTRPSRTARAARRAASCGPTTPAGVAATVRPPRRAGLPADRLRRTRQRRVGYAAPGGRRDGARASWRSGRCASSTPAPTAGATRRPSPSSSPPIRRRRSSATTTSWRSRCSMRCARLGLEVPRRPRPGRLRRHPRRAPVAAAADDGRRPVGRGRASGGGDAGRRRAATGACRPPR